MPNPKRHQQAPMTAASQFVRALHRILSPHPDREESTALFLFGD